MSSGSTRDLADLILAALGRRGMRVDGLLEMRRLTGGAMQETWLLHTSAPAPLDRIVLRRAPQRQAPRLGTISLSLQARLTALAEKVGVPGPAVLAVFDDTDGLGEGFIMGFVAGETVPQRILRQPQLEFARNRLTDQCADVLARLHAIPTEALPPLPQLSPADRLEALHEQYRQLARPRPVFELAFAWLQRRLPPPTPRPGLVHGDFRNGNLMVDETGLAAVLDWERAFVGDPMFDIGWLCVGSWRFGLIDNPIGGFGDLESFAAAYRAHGGEFEIDRVRFWEAFGSLDWGVTTVELAREAEETGALETAAIGRRTSETEIDLLRLMTPHD